jgi:putative DNA primase/helicase
MNNENTTTAVAVEAVEAIEVGAVKEVSKLTPIGSFKDIAMPLAARAIPVIPIPSRQKGANLKGWQNLATTDSKQIEKWNAEDSQQNVGAVAKLDGFWMLDCDVPDLPQTIEKETGEVFPRTFSVKSSKGLHFYFKHTFTSRSLKKTIQLKDEQGNVLCDVKVHNGYVVGPGSIHPTGARYEVVNDAEITDAPNWLVSWIKAQHEHAEADEKHQHESIEGQVKEGGRNTFLFEQACRLRASGLSQSNGLIALRTVNDDKCAPPLEETELCKIVGSAYSYEPTNNALHELIEKPDLPSNTDLGNARRLVLAEGKDIHYSYCSKKWFVWDGRKWAADEAGEIHRRAKRTVRAMLQEAATLEDDQKRNILVAHEQRSESEGRLNAMISLARSEPGVSVRPADCDSDPMILNCLNGTIDLKTGTLREHCRHDLASKIAPVESDPSAVCPTWLKFLDTITGHSMELNLYLQRCAGYSLTGDTNEHALVLLYGTGANGKSTFLEVLRFVLGDYAQSADFQSLMVSQGQSVRNDLAKLNGARFVTATESEDGKRMAENVVKQLTGGDTITTRFLYQDYFEFEPQFKLWLGTNHKPVIRGQDVGIWRRIRLIPFTVSIPLDEQDHDLKRKLKLEAPGILNWAIEGLAQWRTNGLQEPAVVKDATKEYRADQDVIGHFLDARCIEEVGVKSSARSLYTAYKEWAQESNEWTMSERRFSTVLTERGLKKVRHGAGIMWEGIAILGCEPPPSGNY